MMTCASTPPLPLRSAWRSGQDQAMSLKLLLEKMLPNVQLYLDVDCALRRDAQQARQSQKGHAVDGDWMQRAVSCSSVVVALLTGGPASSSETEPSDVEASPSPSPIFGRLEDSNASRVEGKKDHSHYFRSRNCMIEMHKAMVDKKCIVLLVETDEDHGGVPMDVHIEQCKLHAKAYKDEHKPAHNAVGDVGQHSAPSPVVDPESVANPNASVEAHQEDMYEHLFVQKDKVHLVPWFRYAELQEVSVRMIAEAVLQAEARPDSDEAKGSIYVHGDLGQQRWQLRQPNKTFHVFVSEHNKGARKFISWLRKELGEHEQFKGMHYGDGLQVTYDVDSLESADFFLLYLNGQVWKDAEKKDALIEDMRTAICAGKTEWCIVHEMRERFQGELSFKQIYRDTPQEIRRELLANHTALPMTDGMKDCVSPEHELACISVLLRQLCPRRPLADWFTNCARSLIPENAERMRFWFAQLEAARADARGDEQRARSEVSVDELPHHRMSEYELPSIQTLSLEHMRRQQRRSSSWFGFRHSGLLSGKSSGGSRPQSRKGSLLPGNLSALESGGPGTSQKGLLAGDLLTHGAPTSLVTSRRSSLVQGHRKSSCAPERVGVAVELGHVDLTDGQQQVPRGTTHARGRRVSIVEPPISPISEGSERQSSRRTERLSLAQEDAARSLAD